METIKSSFSRLSFYFIYCLKTQFSRTEILLITSSIWPTVTTPIVTESTQQPADCEHISIEANYDLNRLISGPYPPYLKKRISGRGGHLSNQQTADILAEILHPKLSSIVLCHISEKNNAPHLAESEVLHQIGERFNGVLSISKQEGPEFSHKLGQGELEQINSTL